MSLVIDAREGSFLEDVGLTLDQIAKEHPLSVLWLDAQNSALIKRFQMTKRRHPLGEDLPIAIADERKILTEVTRRATARIDTSHLSPHELAAEVRNIVAPEEGSGFRVKLCSFGFRHGTPIDMDQLLDVRFLPNPYWEESLQKLTGCDESIGAFMEKAPSFHAYIKVLKPFLLKVADLGSLSGKPYMSIGIGCTGGQHRSVYVVECLAQSLEAAGFDVVVEHRNLPDANT